MTMMTMATFISWATDLPNLIPDHPFVRTRQQQLFSTPNTAKLFRAGAYTEHLSPAKRDPQERESFSSCIGTMAENNIVAKNVCSPAVKPLGFVGVAGDN